MTWTVKTLDLGLVELNRRRMIANAGGNGLVRVPVQGWLLLQGNHAIVIDTGFRHPDILKRLGDSAAGIERPEQRLVRQLAIHGDPLITAMARARRRSGATRWTGSSVTFFGSASTSEA